MKKSLYILLSVSMFLLVGVQANSETLSRPKSIILFIGDGMGVSQVTAAVMMGIGDNFLRFKNGGFSITRSSDSWITDSAASATSIASGKRTYNKAIGVNDDKVPLKNIVEYAQEMGMSTGLIATSSITHATPASFATHVEWRKNELEIAGQLSESNLNVLIGGGRKYFLPEKENGDRKDNRNLLKEMADKGFSVAYTMDDLFDLNFEKVENLVALLAHGAINKEKNPELNLSEMTNVAINILSKNENGFFLMVEGSQIDWESHDNEYEKMLFQMKDFNDALGVGLDYFDSNEDILVIMTADHETGGLALHQAADKTAEFEPNWTSRGHTGVFVPILSSGPGSENFGGILNIAEIGERLIDLITNR